MRVGTQLLFATVIAVAIVSVGLVFLTQLRDQSVAVQPVEQLEQSLQQSEATPAPAIQPVRLLFGGDLMFDRNIRLRMQEFGVEHPLSELKTMLNSYDAVVANLEGPITTANSRSVGSAPGSTNNFFFTFQPEIVPMLAAHNLTILNLGNNHITNFGIDGILQTKEFLRAGGIAFFGNTGQELSPEERIHYAEFGAHRLAFVNLNQFTNRGFETALEDTIVATRGAEIVIVLPHWGEEYASEPNAVIRQQAHQLIDAGADAIIGAHPHVIQSVEEYQGKQIYYSLGNFVFDQYFQPAVQRGLLVELEILPDGSFLFAEVRIRLEKNGQTILD